MVALINKRNADISTFQIMDKLQAAEACTNDEDMGVSGSFIEIIHLRLA